MSTGQSLLLGVDVGTSSTKVVVLDSEGIVHGEAAEAYPVRTPQPRWAESTPADWWDAIRLAVRRATESAARAIASVTVVGQMHGVVLTHASGDAVRPAVLWADARAGAELDRYASLGENALERLANPVVAGMAGPSLLWLREHEADKYSTARWALQPKDWVRMQLTGEAAGDPSDASATLLYDVPADDWAWSIVDRLGLRRDLLAPLVPSGEAAGTLMNGAADALGLTPGLPVAAGAADTAAAALGSGLLDPGPVQLTVGTGGQVIAPLHRPAGDPTRRTHTYRAAAPDRWYAMAATLNAGLALEWVRRIIDVEWDEFYGEAFAVPAGAGGVRFLPYLSGERTPHLDRGGRGVWSGLGTDHHRGHLLRAALEGVAFALRDCVAALDAAGEERSAASLRIAGGGTRNPLWRQMLTDVLRRPLAAVETPNASARGAALLAGVTAGVYPDVRATLALAPSEEAVTQPGDAAGEYDAVYEEWRATYRRISDGGDETSGGTTGSRGFPS